MTITFNQIALKLISNNYIMRNCDEKRVINNDEEYHLNLTFFPPLFLY